jgi:predicted CoA-binding protein
MERNIISDNSLLNDVCSIHVFGAGLNKERNAWHSINKLTQRGFRVIPIHVRDAGATISGIPIRSGLEKGVHLEIIVLFLAPKRARDVVRSLLLMELEEPPMIWFQPGAEDEMSISWLNDAGWTVIYDDCIVEYSEKNNISKLPLFYPWFLQIQDKDGTGSSNWSVHDDMKDIGPLTTKLEWVGDLIDLEFSEHNVPTYIRSLKLKNENLEQCARRLVN